MKILLLGYFGYGNFGDELIYKAAERLLSKQHHVSVIVNKKLKLKDRKYVRRGFCSILLALWQHDVLLFPGGSVFQDKSSRLSPVYYAFWAYVAKLLKKKLILSAQGIGPLTGAWNLRLVRKIFSLADFVSLRDQQAADFCRQNKIKFDYVGADIVWSLLTRSENADKDLEQKVYLGNSIYRYTITELMGTISRCRSIISDRYHVILVACLLGAKVALIGDDPKLKALAKDLAVDIYPEYSDLIEAKFPSNIGLMKKRSDFLLQKLTEFI